MDSPYYNDDPQARWLGPENLGYAFIDGERTRVLLDDGARMNLVTPEYAEKRGWKHYPLKELVLPPSFKSFPPISGVGGCLTDEAAGCVIFNVQVEGIPSYNKNQVAIVMPDDSNFSR